jgi:uncharacterized LabA/DUF88 family protein
MPTAVLVDGTFFLKRYRYLRGDATPQQVAGALHWIAREHAKKDTRELYRIFYYDCPPLQNKVHNPITGQAIDFSKTPIAAWRISFLDELKKQRKLALRLGYLNTKSAKWSLKGEKLKQLLSHRIELSQLTENDVRYDATQKGVDMKIGLDIASMAFKKQVRQIVLISGDSDFVPAAKLARREGIDFILDPMWAPIREDLHEHIDGLRSIIEPPKRNQNNAEKG